MDFCPSCSMGNCLERNGALAGSKIKPKILVHCAYSDKYSWCIADNLSADSKREKKLIKKVVESVNESFFTEQFISTVFGFNFPESCFCPGKN